MVGRMDCIRRSIVACALVSVGCGSVVVVDGIEVYEGRWRRARESVESVAAFQLDCPRDALSYTLLRRVGREVTQVGVSGCGQRDVYTKVGEQWFSSGQSESAVEEQRRLDAAAAARQSLQNQQSQQ